MKKSTDTKLQCDLLIQHIDLLTNCNFDRNGDRISNENLNRRKSTNTSLDAPLNKSSIERIVLKKIEEAEECPAGRDTKYLIALKRIRELMDESKEDEYSTLTWDGYDYDILESRKNKELQLLLDTLKQEVDPDTLHHLERLRLWRRRRPDENLARIEKAKRIHGKSGV